MKKIYKDYSPQTAKHIVSQIPTAYNNYKFDGGRWGPGLIADACPFEIKSRQVGLYLKAMWYNEIRDFSDIPNPYKPKKKK